MTKTPKAKSTTAKTAKPKTKAVKAVVVSVDSAIEEKDTPKARTVSRISFSDIKKALRYPV